MGQRRKKGKFSSDLEHWSPSERDSRRRIGVGPSVDDAVDRVGVPHAGAGPTNDFDPLDVFQWIIHRVPENTREEQIVERAPIDLHEQIVA